MKSQQTKELEQLLVSYTNKIGTYGCKEVKIGSHATSQYLTNEQEYVDYMTITTTGIITCYEIKSSLTDITSDARLSFVGHKNYFVMPIDLYNQIQQERWFLGKLENHTVGVIVLDNNKLTLIKRCKTKTLSIGTQILLLESFAKSASRDAMRYYNLETK